MRPLRTIVEYCRAARWFILMSVAFTLAIGELYMRLALPRLEYRPDADLGASLAPAQHGYVWLANVSLQSPPISLNSDGHRGVETDWSQPVVLVLGDSEWFGAGVADHEVWTSVITPELRRVTGIPTLQVVNASHPGHGPYHQLVVARRLLTSRRVEAILIRVSIGQQEFKPPPLEAQARRTTAAQLRLTIRHITKFLPFVLVKLEAQGPSIGAAFVPAAFRKSISAVPVASPGRGDAMGQEASEWWEQLVTLANGCPVVFVIHDLDTDTASSDLERHLNQLSRRHQSVHVFRLGPEQLGLDSRNPEELRRFVADELTLGRDPHANSQQHFLIAQAILRSLNDTGVSRQIGNEARGRSPVR
jgi:hypothetical protein